MRRPVDASADVTSRSSTPSDWYNEEYYLTDCEGHESFGQATTGVVSSPRLAAALDLVRLRPAERILDVGCGRGEAVLGCERRGAEAYGIDYSVDALRIARRCFASGDHQFMGAIYLARANAKQLPFPDASFDKLLMLDLVEHLHPRELAQALGEAWRVLRVRGQLIIHTGPNRWYYLYGYPLYRLFERLRGKRLPPNPRSRFRFHHLHVNEQDVLGLRRSLRRAGFEPKVWLDNIRPPLEDESSPALRLLLWVLLQAYPFRWVFRNDIFAIASK
jgi:SAM-dependent methyltransferase